MKSKIIKKENKADKRVYPCLLQNVQNGEGTIVVLATSATSGITLFSHCEFNMYGIFDNSGIFDDTLYWKPFEGTLELSN